MANNDCLPQVQGCAIRVAYLDPNGVPTPGANELYVSDALTTLTWTPNYEDGEEINEKTACGGQAVYYQDDPILRKIDVELTIASHDPFLVAMLDGGDVLTDAGVHGWAISPLGKVSPRPISLEIWAKRIDDGELADEYPYAWWVLPRLTRLKRGASTMANAANLPTFTAQGYENPNWFDGPLNDWVVESDRAVQWFPSNTIPTPVCGPQSTPAS